MHDIRTRSWRRAMRAGVAAAFAVMASAAIAGGGHGGGGGGGGDSSMNPYTGDSYAYFHGGRNLGEQGTIRPGGTPPATGWSLWPAPPTRNDSSKATTPPTARFTPAPDRDLQPPAPGVTSSR